MSFKDNLRKQRTRAALSQESLAEKLSVSRQTVSKWENGDAYPSTEHIFALAALFGCQLDDLLLKPRSEATDDQPQLATASPQSDQPRLATASLLSNQPSAPSLPSNQSAAPSRRQRAYLCWAIAASSALILAVFALAPAAIAYYCASDSDQSPQCQYQGSPNFAPETNTIESTKE